MNVELMLEVKRRVLAEPKCVDMTCYRREVYARNWRTLWLLYAPCHTAGCIAGHAVDAQWRAIGKGRPNLNIIDCYAEAKRILSINDREAQGLFFPETMFEPYVDLWMRLRYEMPGTPEYAAIVAQAIDRCIARHVEQPEPTPQPELPPADEPDEVETEEEEPVLC